MKNLFKQSTAFLTICVFLLSCKKETSNHISTTDIYIAGSYVNNLEIACYWKNGTRVDLSDGTTDAGAYSIVVTGNDVYVSGYYDDHLCYWKNSVKTILPVPENRDGYAYSLFIHTY